MYAAEPWASARICASAAAASPARVSAATEKPIRLKAAEAALRGAQANETTFKNAGEAAAGEVETMADARGSASYKKELVRVFVARAVRKALGLGDAQGRAA